MATKNQYITSLLTEIGRADLTVAASEWFDDIYQIINSYYDWGYLDVLASRATVIDTYRYAWPADFRNLKVLYLDTGDTNSRELRQKGIQQFIRLHPRIDSEASGFPFIYTDHAGHLMVAPKPSSAAWFFRMCYVYNPPNITGLQSPIFPTAFEAVMRAGLRGHGYARIREFAKSKSSFEELIDGLKVLQAKEEPIAQDAKFLQKFSGPGAVVPSDYWLDPNIAADPA